MNQKVIDVSYHNGKIDWEAIKNANIHAIIRCGYGDDAYTQDDKQYLYNISECERLNIPFGLYLYSYATSWEQIKSEVSHTLRLAEGHQLSAKSQAQKMLHKLLLNIFAKKLKSKDIGQEFMQAIHGFKTI